MNYDILQYLVSLEIMEEPVLEEDLEDLETLEQPMEPDTLAKTVAYKSFVENNLL